VPERAPEPAPGPAPKPGLRRLLEAAVVAAFLGFICWAAVRQWRQVSTVIGDLSASAIGVSAIATLAGIWLSFLSWRAILADFGSHIPLTAGMRIFFVGQASKYVPGKVWPILTQVRLGRDYQVPGRASAAAAVIFTLIVFGSGLLVAICSLPILGADAFDRYWWALLALPVAAVVLWPPVLNWALGRAMRLARREPMPQPLSAGGIGRAVGWAVVMWLLFGVHLWALLAALDVDAPNLLVRSIGAFAGAWGIGFLLFITPAGVGPREVALVVLLGSTAAQPEALVAAVVSRLLMTLGDLAWPLIAIALERRRQRTAGTAAAAPPVRD
jgi:glycosyltransferase 2 family protein